MKHEIILSLKDSYCSFPSVSIMKDGTAVCVFRKAGHNTAKKAITNTHSHQDMDSEIYISFLRKGVSKWTKPKFILKDKDFALNDPSITIDKEDNFILRVAKWKFCGS